SELVGRAIDVPAVRECRREATVRGEIAWLDGDGGPQERERGDALPVLQEQRRALFQRVEIALVAPLLGHRGSVVARCAGDAPHAGDVPSLMQGVFTAASRRARTPHMG